MSGREDKTKGKIEELKGKGKQAWGDLTDDEKTRAEGERDEAKGKLTQGVGHLKDAKDEVKKAFDPD